MVLHGREKSIPRFGLVLMCKETIFTKFYQMLSCSKKMQQITQINACSNKLTRSSGVLWYFQSSAGQKGLKNEISESFKKNKVNYFGWCSQNYVACPAEHFKGAFTSRKFLINHNIRSDFQRKNVDWWPKLPFPSHITSIFRELEIFTFEKQPHLRTKSTYWIEDIPSVIY